MGRGLPQHEPAIRGDPRPQLPGQPAQPAPLHRPPAPGHGPQLPPPAPRKVTSWILTPPAKLAGDDHDALKQITARFEEINLTCALVRHFPDIPCGRPPRTLPPSPP